MSNERDAAARPLVYVAGPITSEPWACVRKATTAAAILDDLGCWAYLPQMSVLHEIVAPMPYEHWIAHGLAMVERCDGLWRLKGESPGADREVAHAMELQIPVFGLMGESPSLWRAAVQQRFEERGPVGGDRS